MTPSSNPQFLTSALWSIFWEPIVDCNAVSPWCDGIIEILEPLVKSSNLELLGYVFALCQSNHTALWRAIVLFRETTLIKALIPFLKQPLERSDLHFTNEKLTVLECIIQHLGQRKLDE